MVGGIFAEMQEGPSARTSDQTNKQRYISNRNAHPAAELHSEYRKIIRFFV